MSTWQVRAYERKYRDDVLALMFYSRLTHTHLDWYRPSSWLDTRRFLLRLVYDAERLLGFIGVSEPLYGASWVRLMALARDADPEAVLSLAWEPLCAALRAADTQTLSILVTSEWVQPQLTSLGLHYLEDVVTLHRRGIDLPDAPKTALEIRNAYLEDLDDIVRVDHEAFGTSWQMSETDLRHAQRQAASCTIALHNAEVIGYQLSTRHHNSGHLARLAVLPQMQGKRVGAALLHHLIRNFNRRNVRSMTVNTQASNTRSQRLYQRYGFERNGYDLPIWRMTF